MLKEEGNLIRPDAALRAMKKYNLNCHKLATLQKTKRPAWQN